MSTPQEAQYSNFDFYVLDDSRLNEFLKAKQLIEAPKSSIKHSKLIVISFPKTLMQDELIRQWLDKNQGQLLFRCEGESECVLIFPPSKRIAASTANLIKECNPAMDEDTKKNFYKSIVEYLGQTALNDLPI